MDHQLTKIFSKMSRAERKSFAESKSGIALKIRYCATCDHCKLTSDFVLKKMCTLCRMCKSKYVKQKLYKLTDAQCSEIALKDALIYADNLFK